MGVSRRKWEMAALAGVNTLNGSIGGGCLGLVLSWLMFDRKFDISMLIHSVLGGLVSTII